MHIIAQTQGNYLTLLIPGTMPKISLAEKSNLVLVGVTLAWIFDSIDIMLLALLGSEIGISFGYSPNEWTSRFYLPIFGAQLLFTTIGGLVFGSIGDRLGRKKSLLFDIALYTISALIIIFTI
ncbi:MAG: MFS transporter, partial [Thermoplasmata archaeon]